MSFRTRLALVAAAAVGIAVVAASVTVFVVVHNELFGEVDRALFQRAREISGPDLRVEEGYLHVPGPSVGVQSDFVQAVPLTGPPFVEPGASFRLPVTGKDREAARGEQSLYYANRSYQGSEFRVLTIPSSRSSCSNFSCRCSGISGTVGLTVRASLLYLVLRTMLTDEWGC